jgi:transcriptional repressor NrdR
MKCPACGALDSKVVDSRPTEEYATIRRRRECIQCGKRFTTYEKIESMPILVVKKDGRREVFDRQKVINALLKACGKRPVAISDMESMVDDIEKELSNSLTQEIQSEQVGEMIMDRLKDLDEVAYVRFASVYRSFKDINTFMAELKKLLGDAPSNH